ncbi:MAG: hypothetical protein L6R48_20265 [Planctomycetes bacterium]|nr:hypothetical protein [Planctomycetota bacterium]
MSYEVCRLKGWQASSGDNAFLFSPKWTYNQVNGGVDSGSYMSDTFNVLLQQGAATWSQWPYDTDYLGWCLDSATWKSALRWRLASVQTLSFASTSTGISSLKAALANGYVAPFATYVTSWVKARVADDRSTASDDRYVDESICSYMQGNYGAHIMTFVGYDDSIWCDINGNGRVDSGERGAFKVANSWGASDWNRGFRWVSYDAFYSSSQVSPAPTDQSSRLPLLQSISACYYLTVRDRLPTHYGRFTLNHASRGDMSISLGLSAGTDAAPTATTALSAFAKRGGPYAFDGGYQGVDGTFFGDMSDLVAAHPSLTRCWLVASNTGYAQPLSVKDFAIEDAAGNALATYQVTPADGVVNGGVTGWARWHLQPCRPLQDPIPRRRRSPCLASHPVPKFAIPWTGPNRRGCQRSIPRRC